MTAQVLLKYVEMPRTVADMQAQDVWRSPKSSQPKAPLSSWLRKRKSGASLSRMFKETNWRLFTLDYENKIVYYSHEESGRSVSFPIRFSDLLGVDDLPSVPVDSSPMLQRSPSTSSTSSSPGLSRIASLPRSKPIHGFRLYTRTKNMELLCSSRAEVDMWIAELTSAIAMGAEQKREFGQCCGYGLASMQGDGLRLAAQAA